MSQINAESYFMSQINAESYESHVVANTIDNKRNNPYDDIWQNSCHSCSVHKVSQGELDRREKEKERNQSMSYAHAILAQNCIIMASDSRSVHKDNHNYIQWYDDGMQKVAYLPNMKIGIVTTGINTFNGKPVCDFLMDMDAKIDESNTVYKSFSKIIDHLKHFLPDDHAIINIACGGYDDGNAVLLSSDVKKNEATSILDSNFMWNGGYDVSAIKLFKNYETVAEDDIRLRNFGKKDGQNIVLEEKNIAVNIPSVKTLIEFSDYMMETEIQRAKFTGDLPVAGGTIQTLLLTPDGEKWIHTLY